MNPIESSVDWPYFNYPPLLPYVPLREVSQSAIGLSQFADQYTWQGIDNPEEQELIAIIPAMSKHGVSMWGPAGDDESVQIIFRYNYQTHLVTTYNECT